MAYRVSCRRAWLLWACLLFFVASAASVVDARTPRPHAVVYVQKRGATWGIRHQPLRALAARWLTSTKTAPTGLQCTADGSHVVYVENGGVYARRLTGAGAPRKLGSLPGAVWDLHRLATRSFVQLSPSGQYVALPDAEGVRVVNLEKGEDLVIRPPTTGEEGSQKVRVIHPPRWMPDRDAILYLTQQGETGPGEVNARVFDMVQGRHTLWFPVLTKPVTAVEAFDAVIRRDGTTIALSLAVRREKGQQTVFRVISVNPYKTLSLPQGVAVGRIHGFDPRLGDVIFTGQARGQPAKVFSYSFTRTKRRLLDLGYLSSGRMVLGFYPERRTALVAQPHDTGPCAGKARLYKASAAFTMSSLVRWAIWTDVVAEDPQGAWFVFRSGSTCGHAKPTLYLMMADGWGLIGDMPARFALLRTVDPQGAALCPLPPPPPGRRR